MKSNINLIMIDKCHHTRDEIGLLFQNDRSFYIKSFKRLSNRIEEKTLENSDILLINNESMKIEGEEVLLQIIKNITIVVYSMKNESKINISYLNKGIFFFPIYNMNKKEFKIGIKKLYYGYYNQELISTAYLGGEICQ